MLKIVLLLQVFCIFVQCAWTKAEFTELDTTVEQFAGDLFFDSILKSADKGNVFLSPWSIYSALSLTLAATSGNTNAQILKGLGLTNPQSIQELHEKLALWQRIELSLNETEKRQVALSLANGAFVDKSVDLKVDFVKLMKNTFLASIQQESFKENPDEARKDINKWVERRTHDKIKELLQPGQVSALTELILVNAVYFKGEWLEKFDANLTENGTFQCQAPNTLKNVKMMKRVGKLPFAAVDDLQAKVLWLPFSDNMTELAIVLPNAKDGLPALEQLLRSNTSRLFDILRNSRGDEREVTLSVPRMKVSSVVDLKNILSETFHMTDLFDFAKADFTPMTSASGLAVSSVVHKAVFEMDEEGATAAAATSIGIAVNSFTPPLEFTVDRPFLLVLLGAFKTPLFMGRIVCLDG